MNHRYLTRAAALALVGVPALAMGGVALGDDRLPAETAEAAKAIEPTALDRRAIAEVRQHEPALDTSERALRVPVPGFVPVSELERLSDAVGRAVEATRPRHPLRGAADYGDSGARFGAQRGGHIHEGQDVFAPAGTPLVAVDEGVVVDAGSDGGRGNYVSIYNAERDETYSYFHMIAPAEVEVGEKVRSGTRVGAVGCTGSCYGDHLHFEIHRGRGIAGEAIDPLPRLRRWKS